MKLDCQLMMTEEELVCFYMALIEEKMDDFSEIKHGYLESIEKLKKRLPAEIEKIDAMCRARKRLTFMEIIFAGNLGFQSNLEHFRNPVMRTFLDVGVDVCLREKTMRGMAEYRLEDQTVKTALQLIPEEEEELCAQVYAYHSYLDTVIPKLAHYRGYLMANDLLSYTEPGYCDDPILTRAYQRWMNEYFETEL